MHHVAFVKISNSLGNISQSLHFSKHQKQQLEILTPGFPGIYKCSNIDITFAVLTTKKLLIEAIKILQGKLFSVLQERFGQNGNFLHNCATITALEIMAAVRSVALEMLYIAADIFAHHMVLKISKHISKQQHKLINELVGWIYPTVPSSLNAFYILYNN